MNTIKVFDKEGKKLINSKDIICPECKESIRIDINERKVVLEGCKNNHKKNYQ